MKNLRLKSARAAKDLSQQQLADLVSVSRQMAMHRRMVGL